MERTVAWWQRSRLELERKFKIDAIDNMTKSHDCDTSHSYIELSWSAGHPVEVKKRSYYYIRSSDKNIAGIIHAKVILTHTRKGKLNTP